MELNPLWPFGYLPDLSTVLISTFLTPKDTSGIGGTSKRANITQPAGDQQVPCKTVHCFITYPSIHLSFHDPHPPAQPFIRPSVHSVFTSPLLDSLGLGTQNQITLCPSPVLQDLIICGPLRGQSVQPHSRCIARNRRKLLVSCPGVFIPTLPLPRVGEGFQAGRRRVDMGAGLSASIGNT
jgi:hypothetical protein